MSITITWKGLFTIVFVITAALLIALRLFVYVDIPNGCRITILPSWFELSNFNIQRSIRILKHASPRDYQDLCDQVSTIDPNLACAGFEGGCFYSTTPRSISVGTSQRSVVWTVGGLVHEVCHAKQFHDGRAMDENECYAADGWIVKQIMEF